MNAYVKSKFKIKPLFPDVPFAGEEDLITSFDTKFISTADGIVTEKQTKITTEKMVTEKQTKVTTEKMLPELVVTTEKFETSKTAITQQPTSESEEEVFTVNFDLTSSETQEIELLTTSDQVDKFSTVPQFVEIEPTTVISTSKQTDRSETSSLSSSTEKLLTNKKEPTSISTTIGTTSVFSKTTIPNLTTSMASSSQEFKTSIPSELSSTTQEDITNSITSFLNITSQPTESSTQRSTTNTPQITSKSEFSPTTSIPFTSNNASTEDSRISTKTMHIDTDLVVELSTEVIVQKEPKIQKDF